MTAVSDLSLHRAVMQALADNPHVHADTIAAQVVDGDVTLLGTVGSILQRDEAELSTRDVPGVLHVDNELRIGLLDSDRRADADTKAAVLDALIADDDLHAATLDVDSHEGTMTLRGHVARPELREKAERIALGVPGVSQVRNHLHFP
jgi:osmotically-inducible protein OsmY